VHRLSPRWLAVAGVLCVLIGAVLSMSFSIAQSSCQDGPNSVVVNPQLAGLCSGDAWGARAGYVVLVVGAVLVLVAGLAATPRYSRRTPVPDRPTLQLVEPTRASDGSPHGPVVPGEGPALQPPGPEEL